jgi:hypothetical protein
LGAAISDPFTTPAPIAGDPGTTDSEELGTTEESSTTMAFTPPVQATEVRITQQQEANAVPDAPRRVIYFPGIYRRSH